MKRLIHDFAIALLVTAAINLAQPTQTPSFPACEIQAPAGVFNDQTEK